MPLKSSGKRGVTITTEIVAILGNGFDIPHVTTRILQADMAAVLESRKSLGENWLLRVFKLEILILADSLTDDLPLRPHRGL